MNITVSIIIPFYKNFNLLKRALQSIEKQSLKNYEVIIIHDNPENKLDYSFDQFSFKKKIKFIYNKKNLGAGFSRNRGINISKGEYVAFLDSDDAWSKNKLLNQINFMKKNNYLASHTNYDEVTNNGRRIISRNAYNLNYKMLLKSCDIGLSTVILKKIVFKKKIFFPNLKTKEDYVLWLNLAKSGIIFYGLNINLAKRFDTPNSLSKSTRQKLKDAFTVYFKYQKLNFMVALIRTIILSINFIFKKKWI